MKYWFIQPYRGISYPYPTCIDNLFNFLKKLITRYFSYTRIGTYQYQIHVRHDSSSFLEYRDLRGYQVYYMFIQSFIDQCKVMLGGKLYKIYVFLQISSCGTVGDELFLFIIWEMNSCVDNLVKLGVNCSYHLIMFNEFGLVVFIICFIRRGDALRVFFLMT